MLVFCRFNDPKSPACPQETRDGLLQMLKDYARNGAHWAKDALTLRPCEMWQGIRGRTVWFAGDSVTQASILPPASQNSNVNSAETSLKAYEKKSACLLEAVSP